jgi:DNA invertase Pin-like site-specific DNA recombinase
VTSPNPNQVNKEQVIDLIEQNYTNAFIAMTVGCHRNTVSRIKNQPRPRRIKKIIFQSKQERNEKILELKNIGESNVDIGRYAGCHRNTVRRVLNNRRAQAQMAKDHPETPCNTQGFL